MPACDIFSQLFCLLSSSIKSIMARVNCFLASESLTRMAASLFTSAIAFCLWSSATFGDGQAAPVSKPRRVSETDLPRPGHDDIGAHTRDPSVNKFKRFDPVSSSWSKLWPGERIISCLPDTWIFFLQLHSPPRCFHWWFSHQDCHVTRSVFFFRG